MNDDPAAHGLEPALELTLATSPRSSRARRGERRLRAAVRRRARDLARDGADRLRRRRPPRAHQQLRGADRRPALPAGRHGQHGQHHRRRRARADVVARAATRSTLIGADGRERMTAEELARRIGTINYEITVRDLRAGAARVPPRREPGVSVERSARGARRGRATSRPGWSAARCATGCSGGPPTTTTSRSTGDARAAGTRARALGRRARVRAVGGVRRVAGGGARPHAGRSICCR